MKRRRIVCITLAAILLVVGAAYWAFCRLPHLTGSTIIKPLAVCCCVVSLLCSMRSLRKGKESREIILLARYNVSVRS